MSWKHFTKPGRNKVFDLTQKDPLSHSPGWRIRGEMGVYLGHWKSLICPDEGSSAAQPWGCSASTSCVIFTACCLMFPSNHWTQLPPHSCLRSPSRHLCNINKTLRPTRWSELHQVEQMQGTLTNGGGGRGAAGLTSEAWLMIVPVRPGCQLWQWNTISLFALLLLTNHGWDFGEVGEREGGLMHCKGSTSEVVVWGKGWDATGGVVTRSVPLGSWITPALPGRYQYY